MEEKKNEFVRQVAEQKYEFGFTTDVHTEIIEKGLNEDIVRLIMYMFRRLTISLLATMPTLWPRNLRATGR